jgi:hypothetical protein
MNIDPFTQQHAEIQRCMQKLRRLSYGGIAINADQIAALIIAMRAVIKLYLAVDDRALYPSHGEKIQPNAPQLHAEMRRLARSVEKFSAKWNTAQKLRSNEESFKFDSGIVLRRLRAWTRCDRVDDFLETESSTINIAPPAHNI